MVGRWFGGGGRAAVVGRRWSGGGGSAAVRSTSRLHDVGCTLPRPALVTVGRAGMLVEPGLQEGSVAAEDELAALGPGERVIDRLVGARPGAR